jgi:hypothetical protein
MYFAENYHGSNTGFLVAVLVSVVSGVFITFALVALCYRSVVVHKNITLCLRLVLKTKIENFKILFFLFESIRKNNMAPSLDNRKKE